MTREDRVEITLTGAKTSLQMRRSKQQAENRLAREFMIRQQRAATSFHDEVFRKGLSAAGVDIAALEGRHRAERDSAIAFLDKRLIAAQTGAEQINRRHQSELVERAARWIRVAQPAPSAPPDHVVSVLDYLDRTLAL